MQNAVKLSSGTQTTEFHYLFPQNVLGRTSIGLIYDRAMEKGAGWISCYSGNGCVTAFQVNPFRYNRDDLFCFMKDHSFVILMLGKYDLELLSLINEFGQLLGITTLFSYLHKSEAHIGPIMVPHITPCYECLLSQNEMEAAYTEFNTIVFKNLSFAAEINYPRIFIERTADIICHETCLYLHTDRGSCLLGNEMIYDMVNNGISYHHIVTNPFCSACRENMLF